MPTLPVKKGPSIYDIATHLKVSVTTVSFVLNGKAEEMRISDAVAGKIRKYADAISYHPNMIAKSLRTGKSRIIGMMVEDISDPFFSSIARGVERIAYGLGYKIFFASTENETDKAKGLVKAFRERQVDAYIMAPPPGFDGEIQSLLNDGKPVILFDRYYPGIDTNNIIVDNYGGTVAAIEYFQNVGCQSIGFITLESDQSQMKERERGYRDAIKKTSKKACVLKVPYLMDNEVAINKMKDFLAKNKSLDAVLFGTNYLTLKGLDAIRSLKLKVPNDIAIISFDDSPVFHLLSPAITAIAQPVDAISETVVNKVLHCLDNTETEEAETMVLPTEFVIRDSARRKKTRSV